MVRCNALHMVNDVGSYFVCETVIATSSEWDIGLIYPSIVDGINVFIHFFFGCIPCMISSVKQVNMSKYKCIRGRLD